MYSRTTAFNKIASMNSRIRAVAGGTSASKTISILLYLIARAQTDKVPTLTSVVSESFPHLKRGAIRDFINIMTAHGYYKDELWNRTDYIYTFETGSKIEFFSADQASKTRGPRRDRLFVNEGNNVSEEAWSQMLVRTKEFAFIDWNPVSEFYMYTNYIGKRSDVQFITLTYKDNEALASEIIGEIEARKDNKAWWKVYGEGQLGEVEGRIYTDWHIIDEIPKEARLERRGLDFGYSVDPAAIIDIYFYNGGYVLDERLYRKGMLNKNLADYLNNLTRPQTLVMADSAEPKSIEEIKQYGVNILAVKKGQGSIKAGIDFVQSQSISVTKNSLNLIKEYRSYLWRTDRDGRAVNEPEGGFDHALDAVRYGFEGLRPKAKPTIQLDNFYARRAGIAYQQNNSPF
jgi:phage terminase large subunit